MSQKVRVALVRQETYKRDEIQAQVAEVLTAIQYTPPVGARVLVKPNLLKATPDRLVCTDPEVVRAVCVFLLDHGVKPFVGDSPGFGSAVSVARDIGLREALSGLGVDIVTLGDARKIALPFGFSVGISRAALDADSILNVPRVKAHAQLGMTMAVKNLFGCVPGVRKAYAHTKHGDIGRRFESMLIEIMHALPPVSTVVDGVVAMHVKGPIGGEPYPLGVLGASASAVAMDSALYEILGLGAESMPLLLEAQRRGIAGAQLHELDFVMGDPRDFSAPDFVFPERSPVTFHPVRLCISAMKRAAARLR